MDFYRICADLNVEPKDIKKILAHLKKKYPHGEHASLAPNEIISEIQEWQLDQMYLKQIEEEQRKEDAFWAEHYAEQDAYWATA